MNSSRCVLPSAKAWGLSVQLYAARSRDSWGIGDLRDLRRLCRWARDDLGAGFVMVNPLHAALPGLPQNPSPYFPSSRRFRNPLFLCVEDLPGADGDGRRLNGLPLIDRNAAWVLKEQALSRAWTQFGTDVAFHAYCGREDPALTTYATFCTLQEHYEGVAWRDWPEGLRHPESPAVHAFRQDNLRRVQFHCWLQWLLDTELAAAAAELPLVADLAVGFDPDGADAWEFQDVVAPGVSVGAPPDAFNRDGQNWGVAAFDPEALAEANLAPLAATWHAGLAHAAGTRVDHVMGMFRLYFVPEGGAPGDGRYVRYNAEGMLDTLATESQRCGAFVVGEDLGTVEAGVREQLADRNVLSYRLFWFEDGPPSSYPELSLAAVTTHDLPTIPGVWTGSDPDAAELRPRLAQIAGGKLKARDVVERTYAELATAPSLLVAATLEDLAEVTERPNMPGTTLPANWSRPLPLTLEELRRHPLPRRVAEVLRR